MVSLKRTTFGVLGLVLGVPVGALIMVYTIGILGPLVWGPEFYQGGWILAQLGALFGAFFGAKLGILTGCNRPRVFLATFVPLAIFFLVLETVQYNLRRVEEPSDYTVEITAEGHYVPRAVPARDRHFTGQFKANGVVQQIEGKLPAKYSFQASQLDFEITLVDGKENEYFSVIFTANGRVEETIETDLSTKGSIHSLGTGMWKRIGCWYENDFKDFHKPKPQKNPIQNQDDEQPADAANVR